MNIYRNETIVVTRSESEADLVNIALELLKGDLKNVLNAELKVICADEPGVKIVVGTPESPLLQKWFDCGILSREKLQEHPETFHLTVSSGILLIAGSDRRGAAYGIMELSRAFGVSPWEWWADATPKQLDAFTLPAAYDNLQWPRVEFRGIFINDEDVGFDPWATNFEKNPQLKPGIQPTSETKAIIGPKTYSKVFELMIRLRANTLWPAMHACTMPFYLVQGNAEAADRYGILIGSSHCEPMNCNANGEWVHRGQGEYDYISNKDSVLRFWEERLREIGKSDNFYTIGMRGVHDGPMHGAEGEKESREALERVFADQRALLSKYSGKPAERIPQVFIPYKEAFDIYKSGLKVPEDVSLMWCDDNYGYVLRLPTELDRDRPGGAGIYYHISYWGTPYNYLWLSTNHPGQIFRELKRAYENNARRIWIINTGDIKPSEYQLTLALDLAWNIEQVEEQGIRGHLVNWLMVIFGGEIAPELADCMMESYRLAWIRKPESLDSSIWWWLRDCHVPQKDVPEINDCTESEALRCLADYAALEKRITTLKAQIQPELADAWYELVEYPICAAAATNRKYYYGEMAKYGAKNWSESHAEYQRILDLTAGYNALERWHGMMGLGAPNWGPFNEPAQEVSIPKEKVFLPENPDAVLAEFQGLDSSEKLLPAYELGYHMKAAILPAGKKAVFHFDVQAATDLKVRIAMIPTHPVSGFQLRYRVWLNGEELGVVNIYAKDRTSAWCWNVVRNRTTAELSLAGSSGILEIEALDEELLLDCIQVIKPMPE